MACYDQFVVNVLLGEGAWSQTSRDVGLMLVDLLYVVIATRWVCQLQKQSLSSRRCVVSRDELLVAIIGAALMFTLALMK